MTRRTISPAELEVELARFVAGAERVAVLSVGSELRGDDAAGVIVGDLLEQDRTPRLGVFAGGTAPENATGFIREYSPTHLLVIDAVESENAVGSIELIRMEEIGGVTFSTHMLPLSLVVGYLLERCPGCQALVIGIVPRSAAFGFERSPEIAEAAAAVARAIRRAVGR